MNEIFGSFYLTITVNGNLLGEFVNNFSNRIVTESANRQINSTTFEGAYESTWNDGDNHLATLTIAIKPNTDTGIYIVRWEEDNHIIYQGEGFLLHNDTLIGFYTNQPITDIHG